MIPTYAATLSTVVFLMTMTAAGGELAGADGRQTLDVQYESEGVVLAAELIVPPGARPRAAAIIAQGSGTSDRTNQWSRDVANALVERGLAVLLTDKRGSGASQGDWRTASLDDLALDILAGARFLAGRPEIDATRIGVVGLSQGGQVAALAAARSSQVAFVVNVSGKTVTFAEGSFAEMANSARQAGLSDAGVDEVLAVNMAAAKYMTTGDWDAYALARARALTTSARPVAEGFPGEEDAPIWTFLRSAVLFDPLPYWVQVTQPVLVVYGEADEQDNVPVAESVRRLEHAFRVVRKRNYEILVVPGASHGIRAPGSRDLAPVFLNRLTTWLDTYVRRP